MISGKPRLARGLLALGLALGALPATPQEADLATGIRQVDEGDFEAALLTLDVEARRLAQEPGQSSALAQVYLYLGVAYLGLGQDTLARAKFRQALRHNPELRPQPAEFSAKVLRAFEAAHEARAEAVTLEKQARRKSGTAGLILLGVGGAAAAGVAASVVTKERENQAPTASASVSPQGQAIAGVTRLSFTGTASDPEGEPLSYAWSFGDNGSAFGPSVTHVYSRSGAFQATLLVRDGLTSTSAAAPITVGPLGGRWAVSGLESTGVREIRINHTGGGFMDGNLIGAGFTTILFGSVQDPRVVAFGGGTPSCQLNFRGEAASDLRSIAGDVQCEGASGCSCRGQRLPVRMTR